MLVILSENDRRCPSEQAEQLFIQLKRRGKQHSRLSSLP
ncbi:hypothetical protein [Litoribacterium kuwaitense]|nr:hypothetical protein [Litoribacterium kuwaitense]